ncbi:hypothetical protein SFRURICE_020459 [Spodoptera frugiperda]|nr:hypothetical protein SFRURICE_020459 [Spodoptera frugiperda]
MADKLVKRRSSMKAKLTTFSAYLNVLKSCDNLSNLQIIELETRFDKFNALYTEFDELQTEIEVSSDKPDEAYATRDQFEQQYYSLVALARSLLPGTDGKSQHRDSTAKHNTLLHMERTEPAPIQNPMPSTSESIALSANSAANIEPCTRSFVLLSTAMVTAVSGSGERCAARILLDNGSTANFITDKLCNKLRLSKDDTRSTITGVGNQTSTSAQSCNLTIESINGDYSIVTIAITILVVT